MASSYAGASSYACLTEVHDKCTEYFEQHFTCKPKYAAFAPGRVNLIGEHTDYSEGFVFPMALPMVTVVVGNKTDTGVCRVLTKDASVDDPKYVEFNLPSKTNPLEPGKPMWGNYVKGVITHFPGTACSFDAVINSSVPVGGGLSSSAALEVAMFTFLEALQGDTTSISEVDKALACQKAEHTHAGMQCGIMDQFISVMAIEGHALLIDCRSMEGTQVPMQNPDVIVLIANTNVRHTLSNSEYPQRVIDCRKVAGILGKKSLREATKEEFDAMSPQIDAIPYKRGRHVINENKRCEDGVGALRAADFEQFGKLMVESHNSLRDDFEVSCKELDALVEAALEVDGVYGSRMTGGGFGGCTVTLVKSSAVEATIEHMKNKYDGTATFYTCKPSGGASIIKV